MLKFSKKGLLWVVSTWQIIVISSVVLLLFGGQQIPELASGLGKGIQNFKDAVKKGEERSGHVQKPYSKSLTTNGKTRAETTKETTNVHGLQTT